MRSVSILPCRGGDATLLARVRATPELCGVLQRRGGHSAARRSGNSIPPFSFSISAWRTVRVGSALGEAPQVVSAPSVTIRIPYRVNFGEVLRVVGSSSLLGDWSADRGLQLTWTEGDVWTAELPISAGHYEFKCVVYDVNTNSVTRWEDGGNRVLNIPSEPGTWDVSCQWGATADMAQAFTPAPPPPPPPPAVGPEATPAEAAASEGHAAAATSSEEPQAAMAWEPAAEASQPEAATSTRDPAAASTAPADASRQANADADAAPSVASSSGAGGAVMLLLATCAAGAMVAAALLAPGGLESSALGGGPGPAVSSSLAKSSLAQVQSRLAALAGQVEAVQPAVAAQMASVTDGLAALQPRMRAYVQDQASRASAAAADAVGGTVEVGSRIATRQG
ncbi:hypothetical protein PLESTB_001738900 [Pleodorina starrii]|uniref:CBM20 domain-containing protein n=1 Tax=Pleodorina starrii TaxID=330485 RepID=A0A9W6C014_9CHLO|nr:hypothetical protein PLESTM_000747000 [Pleodorina starrii]GLC61278.1 hypothetical protein PLESTB_001738900 [Pleodorina starrii]GLC74716.1 hypothetical protein PLESTF_001547700 [Pleodorina starrii]